MGMFLNNITPYETYKAISTTKYFIDKTKLLEELISDMEMGLQYICITRPRRFGKTVMANMISAFFGKTTEENHIFDNLKICRQNDFSEHLNQHDVIYIDFSRTPENCTSYRQYIARITNGLKQDLMEAYPELLPESDKAVWDMMAELFQKTKQKFIFVMDEWDAVFHMSFISQADQAEYLLFLKNLLKDQIYVELAYMTGILPIAKYSDGSELNMFVEYNMATAERFSEYFGFLEEEVDALYEIYRNTTKRPKITREDLRLWYDGYHTAAGNRIYNPRSIVCALANNQLANYWTSSGTYDSIFGYLKDNVAEIQDDLALLFAGESVPADIQEYAAVSMQLSTRDEIYSAMVIYGLLTYADGYVSIPNKELMESYAAMMKKEPSLGYIYRLANESNQLQQENKRTPL